MGEKGVEKIMKKTKEVKHLCAQCGQECTYGIFYNGAVVHVSCETRFTRRSRVEGVQKVLPFLDAEDILNMSLTPEQAAGQSEHPYVLIRLDSESKVPYLAVANTRAGVRHAILCPADESLTVKVFFNGKPLRFAVTKTVQFEDEE
jgi:hypothetical protein